MSTVARPELRQGAKDANYGYTQHRGHPDEPTRISDPTGGGDVELCSSSSTGISARCGDSA